MAKDIAAQPRQSIPRVTIIGSAVLLMAIVGFYWPVISNVFTLLIKDEDASYGLILPLVSLFIVYKKWPELRSLHLQPSWGGLFVLAAGLGVYLFGELFQSLFIPAFSLIICLAGLVYLIGGWQFLKALSFPLFLLVMMIPYEGFFIRSITLPLQLTSTRLASGMLAAVGVTNYVTGNVIDLGSRQLNIVEACSGLRYIINLLTIGTIFCYFFQRRVWKIAVILIALIPYAIFANVLRIALIAIFPIFQEGMWHTSIGLSIFIMGFDYLKLINWLVNRVQPPQTVGDGGVDSPNPLGPLPERLVSPVPYLVAALVLVVLGGPLALNAAQVKPMPLLQDFSQFPEEIGGWKGHTVPVDSEIIKVTTSDAHFNADYNYSGQKPINLWIAYYEQKKRGKSFHSPAICMTGSGWRVKENGRAEIAPGHPVQSMLMQQESNTILVYYWYMQGGRWVTGDYRNKFAIAWDLFWNNRSDGALIRISMPVGGDVKVAHETLQSFGQLLLPVLHKFIPG